MLFLTNSFTPHNDPQRQIQLLSLFYGEKTEIPCTLVQLASESASQLVYFTALPGRVEARKGSAEAQQVYKGHFLSSLL